MALPDQPERGQEQVVNPDRSRSEKQRQGGESSREGMMALPDQPRPVQDSVSLQKDQQFLTNGARKKGTCSLN